MDKLYIIIREDLPAGLQKAQIGHAAIKFMFDYPSIGADWYHGSNNIVILGVEDEQELRQQMARAEAAGISFSAFQEPDLDNEFTAIALEPKARRLLRHLPTADRQPEATKEQRPLS